VAGKGTGVRSREKLAAEGRCRLCAATKRLTRHHLVPQAWFVRHTLSLRPRPNRNDPRNCVPLCEHCHHAVEGAVGLDQGTRQVRRSQARVRLRAVLTQDEIAYVRSLRGEAWLNHHYPVATSHHDPEVRYSALGRGPLPEQEDTHDRARARFRALFSEVSK